MELHEMALRQEEYIHNSKIIKSMSDFKQYQRKEKAELRPFVAGELLDEKVSISKSDLQNGSPKIGDMIARNPKNHNDQWLVAAAYFNDNFEEVQP